MKYNNVIKKYNELCEYRSAKTKELDKILRQIKGLRKEMSGIISDMNKKADKLISQIEMPKDKSSPEYDTIDNILSDLYDFSFTDENEKIFREFHSLISVY